MAQMGERHDHRAPRKVPQGGLQPPDPHDLAGEKMVMGKTYYYRGSFPMPWLSNTFFVAKGDELYKAALARGGASAGEESEFGAGGGNVTKDFGKVMSIAGKFGIRTEEVPALVKLAYEWKGKSVEEVGHVYEMMVPRI
jgi:4-hydroxyphenylacetate decarboxylase large subunit